MSKDDFFYELKYLVKKNVPKIARQALVKRQYKNFFGRECNLQDPILFSEKVQWSKLYRDNCKLADFADKIKVREYVERSIGKDYLIPIVGGPYDNVRDFRLDDMPEKFVIKANHGCGYNIIVNDRDLVNENELKKTISGWVKHNYAYYFMEMQYEDIVPKIYVEKNILTNDTVDLPDYKFFCFDGKVFCSYTMIDYMADHSKGRLGFFDRDYRIMPYHRKEFEAVIEQLPKPKNYDLMVDVAEKLSKGFSHVRVDLYNVDGKIYFGELTFTSTGGFCLFEPEEFDRIMGNQWDIHKGM